MDMKRCAYCGCEMGQGGRKRTAEHVIPRALIELYPEQDIAFDKKDKYVDNKGITIADVCSVCNGGVLSQLDSYGKALIEQQFLHPYEFEAYYQTFQIELDTPKFMRWILKIIYNEMRREKLPLECIQKYIPYIMTGEGELTGVSFYMGLHVNLNPLPEECFAIMPLQINMEPLFFETAFAWETEEIRFDIEGKEQSCAIRFGNCIVYVVFWKKEINDLVVKRMSDIFECDYRFRELNGDINIYSVRSVSSPTNVMLANYAHFVSEKAVSLIISHIEGTLQGRKIPVVKKQFEELWDTEDMKRGRALTEVAMFPDNKKKLLALEAYYEKDE